MQLLAKQTTVGADKLNELHPLTLEFQTRYGALRFHSNIEGVCTHAIVGQTPQGSHEVLYFVEPTEHLGAAAETLAKYLGVARQHLLVGEVINLFSTPNRTAVSVVLKLIDKELENQYMQVLGQDPYAPNAQLETPKHRNVGLVVDNSAVMPGTLQG